MELILLQKINKLGNIGEVVSVKAGFGRNFLLPSGKALRATKENLEFFEKDKAQLIAKNDEEKKKAEVVKEKASVIRLSIVRSASDTGILYGSVTTRDIQQLASNEGLKISRKDIILDKPIKELGIYNVKVDIHAEVELYLKLNVVRNLSETIGETQEKDPNEISVDNDNTGEGLNETFFEESVSNDTESETQVDDDQKTNS
jgi:large subunit ribosomal protein L9